MIDDGDYPEEIDCSEVNSEAISDNGVIAIQLAQIEGELKGNVSTPLQCRGSLKEKITFFEHVGAPLVHIDNVSDKNNLTVELLDTIKTTTKELPNFNSNTKEPANLLAQTKTSIYSFPKEWLKQGGITLFLFKQTKRVLAWKRGIDRIDPKKLIEPFSSGTTCSSATYSPSVYLNCAASDTGKKRLFHLQASQEGSCTIESNQELVSDSLDMHLKLKAGEKHLFRNGEIKIDEVGTLKEDGSFETPRTTFFFGALKEGITLCYDNDKLTWHPKIIPFSELEAPEEMTEEENGEDDSTEEVMDAYYNQNLPAPLIDYDSTPESPPEAERSYFAPLSDNKGTIVCASIGVAVTAIVAHVLSGRRYLAKTDTWSNWSPDNLNSIGLHSLPEKELLKKLYQEIAYRYGNCSDQIKAFLDEIEQEIYELNLCYWSYSTLRGFYLLPKIQRFEEIEDRIHLLKMLAGTVRQDLANKSIKNLLG